MKAQQLLARASFSGAPASAARLGLLSQRGGFHSSAWAAKVEHGLQQTDSTEGVKQPFVEGDSMASKRQIRDSYRDVLKDKSGTAEDAGVVDQSQSSLGRMMADPQNVEQDYAQKGRDTVASHGGRERESEDEKVADAVFDQQRTDKGYEKRLVKQAQDVTAFTATQPQ